MRLAFPAIGQIEAHGTADSLAGHQVRLHDRKATALLEVTRPAKRFLLLYAHGILVGVYQNKEDECQSVPVSALLEGDDAGTQTRLIPLSDTIGRLAWLTCEANKRTKMQGLGLNAWNQQLHSWKLEGANGLVELTADKTQGFFLMAGGEAVPAESALMQADGSSSEVFAPADAGTAWEGSFYEIDPSSSAFHCLSLRQAARHWSQAVFESYQNIAGEKFLQAMIRELQSQVRPWK